MVKQTDPAALCPEAQRFVALYTAIRLRVAREKWQQQKPVLQGENGLSGNGAAAGVDGGTAAQTVPPNGGRGSLRVGVGDEGSPASRGGRRRSGKPSQRRSISTIPAPGRRRNTTKGQV